uniref:hypothetical protein n=1 Tax=Paenibacillus montaniterrae TaxID=429341 RepID=UPI001BCE97AB
MENNFIIASSEPYRSLDRFCRTKAGSYSSKSATAMHIYCKKAQKKSLLQKQQTLLALGDVLLSQDPAVQVPSALKGLTVVFE